MTPKLTSSFDERGGTNLLVAILLLAIGLVVGPGRVFAQAGEGDVIHACVDGKGKIRVVDRPMANKRIATTRVVAIFVDGVHSTTPFSSNELVSFDVMLRS